MKRLAAFLTLLAVCGLASAQFNPVSLGLGFTATGSTPPTTLQITTASLSSATVGSAYSQTLTATGGTGTGYSFSELVNYPNTDRWEYLTPSGTIGGTPDNAETETVTYQVTDSGGNTAQKTFSLPVSASGALTIVSPTTLPAAVNNGYYAYKIIISGGTPPYTCSGTSAQPLTITPDCWIEDTPTATGTVTVGTVTVTDAVDATASFSPSFTVNSTLTLGGIDQTVGIIRLPPAYAGQYYQYQFHAYGGSGSGYTYTAINGLPAWAAVSASGLLSGTPTSSGSIEPTIKVTDSSSNTATEPALVNVLNAAGVNRPSYNASVNNGFFTLNGRIYDPNGKPFLIHGLDRNHFDNVSWAGAASINWNPGPYLLTYNQPLSVGSSVPTADISAAAACTPCKGYAFWATWSFFEGGAGGTQGNYTVGPSSVLGQIFTAVGNNNQKVIIQFNPDQFNATGLQAVGDGYTLPLYLTQNSSFGAANVGTSGVSVNPSYPYGWYEQQTGGYGANWVGNTNVYNALLATFQAIASQWDGDPRFEAIIVVADDVMYPYNGTGLQGSTYFTQLTNLMLAIKSYFHHTNVVLQIAGQQSTASQQMVQTLVQAGVMMGASDTAGATAWNDTYTSVTFSSISGTTGTLASPLAGWEAGNTYTCKLSTGQTVQMTVSTSSPYTAVTFSPAVTGSPSATATISYAWPQLGPEMMAWAGIQSAFSSWAPPSPALQTYSTSFMEAQEGDFSNTVGSPAFPTTFTAADMVQALNDNVTGGVGYHGSHFLMSYGNSTAWAARLASYNGTSGLTNTGYPSVYGSGGGQNGALSGSNVVREFSGFGQYNQSATAMASQVTNQYANNGIVPIITVYELQEAFTASASGTTLTVTAVNTTPSMSNDGLIVKNMQVIGTGIPNNPQWTGSISSTTMSVTAISSGPLCVGMTASGSGFSTTITAVPGGGACSSSTGSYTVSSSLTESSQPIYGNNPVITNTGGGTGTYSLNYQLSVGSESMTGTCVTSGNNDPNAVVAATNMLVYALNNGLGSVGSKIMINVANEWGVSPLYSGPNTEANWESYYATAISSLRSAGFYGPVVVDSLNDAEDFTVFSGGYAQTLINSDPYKNVVISMHLYNTTNLEGQITSISHGTNAVIKFAYNGATNPWSTLTNFLNQVYVTGVSGMTQINGQTITVTSIGSCSAGACSLNTNLDTSSYGTYTSGGQVFDGAHYQIRFASLANYQAMGIPIIVGEYGPPGLNNTTAGLSQFAAASISYNIGEIEWAWDDSSCSGSWSGWFNDTLSCGNYSKPSDLTEPGMDVIDNPRTGRSMLGVPVPVFH
jgi:hypothetical protein